MSASILGLVITLRLLSLSAMTAGASDIPRYEPPAPPPLTADAVYVVDKTSGTELYALNADAPLPPASLTKIVAALVILERANLDDVVTIVEEDRVGAEESQVGLVAGDRLSVRDLLFGLLIPSGNDAARALARHVGGAALGETTDADRAVAEFVSLMNAKAQELGLQASHFANPTGMDAEGHTMSARDIARATSAALENPLFAEIVSTASAVLPSQRVPEGYAIRTTNLLLEEGIVNGVKTGYHPKAGGCLVASFAVGPNTVLAVVLGSEVAESADGLVDNRARFADTRALLDAVSTDYLWLDPASPGVVDGLSEELFVWDVVLPDSVLLPVPASAAADLRYRLILQPPVAPREPVGEVQFYLGERLLSEQPTLQAG